MVMSASAILGDELTLKKLPFLTPEEVEDRLNDMANGAMDRFGYNELRSLPVRIMVVTMNNGLYS